jgi:DNA-binding transcriptional LysR family regulator
VAQPSLSKQIRELEAELGFALVDRTTRAVSLTDAGAALLPTARKVLQDWQDGVQAATAVHTVGTAVLRVGFVASGANEWTRHILAAFAQTRPGWRVNMTQAPWSDPTAGLASGAVDAALLRLPIPGYETGLRCQVLLTEPRWVAMPDNHRLAHHERVCFQDLLDEPFVATPPDSGGWRDYWLATEERAGHPPRIAAIASNPDEWLEAITNGQGISLTPQASARFYARPGLTYRPVDGVSPSSVGICWRHDDYRPVVHDFVRACQDVARANSL